MTDQLDPVTRREARSTVEEIVTELRQLLAGNVNIADGVLPPLVFVAANALAGLAAAGILGLSAAAAIVVWRLSRGRDLRFALAGLGGTVIAVLFALRSDRAAGYFLPGIISGAVTTIVILISILMRRPFVAWTSWLVRGWPIEWYWHPRVRPAYLRATWLWAVFFGVRTASQFWLYQAGETTALGLARVLTGWPALLVLLAATYLLGRRWLVESGGPSVDELVTGSGPPWVGQRTGF